MTGSGTIDLGGSDLCFTYTPALNFNGQAFLEVVASDDGSPVLTDTVVIALTVNPVDDPPVAVNDTIRGVQDQQVLANVLDNDFDPDGDGITVNPVPISISNLRGDLNIDANGVFTYTPEEEFFGTVSFTYEICDDTDPIQCATAEVVIILESDPRPLLIYQAVSPNGDGFNDTWYIQGIVNYPNNSIKLFDRYNNLIYTASGYDNRETVWLVKQLQGWHRMMLLMEPIIILLIWVTELNLKRDLWS